MGISTVFTTLVIVVGVFSASIAIVASDRAERAFVTSVLRGLAPVLYGILSLLAFLWLVSRDFAPLGGLGSRLMDTAGSLSNGGGSPITFLLSWLGAPIVGLVDILIMLAILACAAVFMSWAVWVLVSMLPELARVFGVAAKRLWSWLLDLVIHPPSLKTIRETLRSDKVEAEQIRTISEALKKEHDKVMNDELPAEVIKAYGRKHAEFAKRLNAGKVEAFTRYNQGIAETARSLRESAERRVKEPSDGGRNE
jgi:hypothetical protein